MGIVEPLKLSVTYAFVRSRQLDGTYPGNDQTGVWMPTDLRIRAGWGKVFESDWPRSSLANWPPAEPPGLDVKAQKLRSLYYQRVRDIDDARSTLDHHGPFAAAFDIGLAWFKYTDGIISTTPDPLEKKEAHAVMIIDYDDTNQCLRVRNSWGTGWGEAGYANLAYSVFSSTMTDAWTISAETPEDIWAPSSANKSCVKTWGMPTMSRGKAVHGIDLVAATGERNGWAFVVERDDVLDVEEFFIRPPQRRRGLGKSLLAECLDLSNRKGLPLRFLVTHADYLTSNLAAMRALFAASGYAMHSSPLQYASAIFEAGNPATGLAAGNVRPSGLPPRPAYLSQVR